MERSARNSCGPCCANQHPDLAELDLHHTVRGWANQLWRLGDELAVRLPRTPDAPNLLHKEHRWLPVLAPLLPLPVPTTRRWGEPTPLFPHVWDDALAAPAYEGPPVWLHADLHPANVVVSGGTLSGVVDFGELCSGDPATDLAAAWVILPEGGAAPFFDAYANADPAMIRRARGWAVLKGLVLLSIGQAGERGLPGGKPTWGPAGRKALDRVLAADSRQS